MTMLPEVIFIRSRPYDNVLKHFDGAVRPEPEQFKKVIHELGEAWQRDGRQILSTISEVLALAWHQPTIPCYISYAMGALSDPLTISYKEDVRHMVDFLNHELIHRILSEPENKDLVDSAFFTILDAYKEESVITRNHIVVHAAESTVLLKVFGEERLQSKIERSPNPDYIRAWEIVKERGYQDILDTFMRLRTSTHARRIRGHML